MQIKNKYAKDVLEIVIAFIIAFAVYQVLIVGTGTSMPIVSVVSESMYHGSGIGEHVVCGTRAEKSLSVDDFWNSCGDYYENLGLTKETFKTFPMTSGLAIGDLLFIVGPKDVKLGDIAIYDLNGKPIIHRIIAINGDKYTFKGDNNPVADPVVMKSQIKGKALVAFPLLGYPRLALYAIGI